VLQNSFDRVVRTSSATLNAFAQNSIDLFQREKPERIVARRTGPTICHETKHRVEITRRTGCFVECPKPVNHICLSEACFPRRRSAGISPGVLLGHTPASSHRIALLLCSEKLPVRKGQILPRGALETVKYIASGRNIVQQRTKLWKDQRNYVHATYAWCTTALPASRRVGSYCDQQNYGGEVNPTAPGLSA